MDIGKAVLRLIGILLLLLCSIPAMMQCHYKSNPAKQIIYVPTPDTMTIQEVVYLKEELRRCQDSLRIIRTDSTMSSELFVAKYKLERIRYYNNIAGKGNNIKFLRGWINRVLNE